MIVKVTSSSGCLLEPNVYPQPVRDVLVLILLLWPWRRYLGLSSF